MEENKESYQGVATGIAQIIWLPSCLGNSKYLLLLLLLPATSVDIFTY